MRELKDFIKNNKLKNIGKKIEMQESHSPKPFVIKKLIFNYIFIILNK